VHDQIRLPARAQLLGGGEHGPRAQATEEVAVHQDPRRAGVAGDHVVDPLVLHRIQRRRLAHGEARVLDRLAGGRRQQEQHLVAPGGVRAGTGSSGP